jgi:hypothetical protein
MEHKERKAEHGRHTVMQTDKFVAFQSHEFVNASCCINSTPSRFVLVQRLSLNFLQLFSHTESFDLSSIASSLTGILIRTVRSDQFRFKPRFQLTEYQGHTRRFRDSKYIQWIMKNLRNSIRGCVQNFSVLSR